ncbi:protein toll-like [Dermacentor albipictus]|uniref:protein toll-like n=1 Tax=Dermacentor albipictus TaxID=60249 RepID=UPI0038FD3D5D
MQFRGQPALWWKKLDSSVPRPAPMHRRRVAKILLVLTLTCTVCLSSKDKSPRLKTKCPMLERCSCYVTKEGIFTRCTNISDVSEIDSDLAKLQGVYLTRLLLKDSNIADLPATWFRKHKMLLLNIHHCGLRDIKEAAISGIEYLLHLQLDQNELESIPSSLTTAKHLLWLQVRWNRIKHLEGTLRLLELKELDLSYNEIEMISEDYLRGLPSLEKFLLISNKIKHLPRNLFRNTTRLKTVKLSNNQLSSIDGLFDRQHRLEVLHLMGNFIRDTDSLVKSKLPNLKEVRLEKNNLSVITKFAPSNFRMRELILYHNSVTEIESRAFMPLRDLVILNLAHNSLSFVNESIFSFRSKLEFLNLSRNKLTTLTGAFNRVRQIRALQLSFNRIDNITGVLSGLRRLVKLSFRNNLISCVPDGTFSDNGRLITVDLALNNIRWLGRYAFKGLLTLRNLRLQNNQLLSLNGSVRGLPKLEYLGVSFNELQVVESGEFENDVALTTVSFAKNNISNVEGAFTGATALRTLSLADNRVKRLLRKDFSPEMSSDMIVTLDNNPLICDCRLAWLLPESSEVRVVEHPICDGPWWLRGEPLRKLTQRDLLRREEGCDSGCQCECHKDSLKQGSIGVNCSSLTMGRILKAFPRGITELDLSGNRLKDLDDFGAKAPLHLRVLSMKNNLLESINVTDIPEGVISLDLSGNILRHLPYDLVTRGRLTSLWLSGNHFTCDCAVYNFRWWIQAHQNVIRDAKDIICAESPNPGVSGKALLTLGEKDLCPTVVPRGTTYLLLSMGLLAIFLALAATYLYYKRRLNTWLRDCSFCGLSQCISEDTDKLFDVFVAFSSTDFGWVHDQILPLLAAHGFTYCTYERNFKGGFLLQDIIRDAVACSRRTLLVLTRNFALSEWCRWEFRFAQQRALLDRVNLLVIVLVDEEALDALDEDLRQYVREANHLRWGEPNFQKRLLNSLPKRDARRKLIGDSQGSASNTAIDVGSTQDSVRKDSV